MEIKMYQNKCRTCGTTTLSIKKAPMCEACGSDDLVYTRQGKTLNIKMLIAKFIIGAAIAGGIASAYWEVPNDIHSKAIHRLSYDLLDVLVEFENRFI